MYVLGGIYKDRTILFVIMQNQKQPKYPLVGEIKLCIFISLQNAM